MKISLALGPRAPLSPQTAWGCFTSNLAVPGTGSLVAGRVSGYPQLALAFGGMTLTMIFGVRFLVWYAANVSRFNSANADFGENLTAMWLAVRWALLGFGLFAVGWLWALGTGLAIVREAKARASRKVPPRLI
jgi:hypothetical protein